MSIVQTDVPMTAQRCSLALAELKSRYPFLSLRTLTQTAFGRPVQVLTMGTGDRRVFYSAAHHANEWITATVLLKFIEELAQAFESGSTLYGVPAKTLMTCSTLSFIPMVDPDGVDLVTGALAADSAACEYARGLADNYPGIPFPDGWKANLMGVDLNLQYPAGWLQAREIKFAQGYTRPGPRDYVGRMPLSQPESQAVADFIRQTKPHLVLALHSQGQVIYWQYRDYDIPGARALAEEFSRLSGYRLSETPYASSFAGLKDWFIETCRRPGFTIEVGTGQNPLPLSQFDEIYRDTLGILVTAGTGLPGQ